MNLDINKIKKIDWYRQETDAAIYFIYLPSLGCLNFFKVLDQAVYFLDGDTCKAYLDKQFLFQKAQDYLNLEKKHPGNLSAIYKKWLISVVKKNKLLHDKVEKSNLKKLSNQAIVKLNKELAGQYLKMWTNFFMDFFDLDSEGLVESQLVKCGIAVTSEERNILMTQELPLVHQRQELEMLKICRDVLKTSDAKNIISTIISQERLYRLEMFPGIKKEVENYQKNFFWIYNSWGSTRILSVFECVQNINAIISGARDINKEIKSLGNFTRDIKKRKLEIFNKYKMNRWLRQMFGFFGLLAYWRDLRKEEVQKMNHYLEFIGREIALRSSSQWENIRLLDPRAIVSLPVSKKLINQYKKLFTERFIYFWDGHSTSHADKNNSAKIQKIIEEIINKPTNEIRGMIGCPGKVKGEVVVIRKESEFHKMKDGAVLVAPMTRPEYVPLMKKAAAIVTDEGGITSHAAVVSRELRVPCIIGTQVGSKILKDGDQVFVNADHGILILE